MVKFLNEYTLLNQIVLLFKFVFKANNTYKIQQYSILNVSGCTL